MWELMCCIKGFKRWDEGEVGYIGNKPQHSNWINVRDPFYFLGYGIPYI